VVGQGALSRGDGAAVANLAARIASAVGAGFNVLHTAAARVGGLDMGFLPREGGRDTRAILTGAGEGALDVVVLIGADEIDTAALGRAFVIYVGSHGDAGANRADVILPGAAYTEKPGIYVNTEGRVQIANRSIFPKGEAREDWAIFRALSEHLGAKLPYDSLEQLRAKLMADHPTFGQVDYVPSTPAAFDLGAVGEAGELLDQAFISPVRDFYLTNPIARASVTMAECSASLRASRAGHARLEAAE
jgi:NADH-quinone oxidoreductase subunit G